MSLVPQYQIDSLLDIYNSLNGMNWYCQWNITNIKNGNLTDKCGIIKSKNYFHINTTYQVVDALVLMADNNYFGTLPSSMFNLTTLNELDLQPGYRGGYGIHGTLPQSFGRLVNLEILNIWSVSLIGTLPSTICNLYRLNWLSISNVNFTGSFPECIFANNPLQSVTIDFTLFNSTIPDSIGNVTYLNYLKIEKTPFIGTVPSTICNLIYLNTLDLSYLNSINGTIPSCIGMIKKIKYIFFQHIPYLSGTMPFGLFDHEYNILSSFAISSTSITGSIPHSLCNNSRSLTSLVIDDNNNLTGPIPSCFDTAFPHLFTLSILRNPLLRGTVSDSFLCSTNLHDVTVAYNTNMDENTIPNCWNVKNYTFSSLIIDNNKWIGVFPKLDIKLLLRLSVANNKLEGTVSDIFGDAVYNKINGMSRLIILQNNKFVDDDISPLLRDWIISDSVQIISLYGNSGIKGTLPAFDDFDHQFINNDTQIFLLHECDIHGTIPKNWRFGKDLGHLTLFNNRLSCQVPDHFAPSSNNENISNPNLILLGNLFESDDNNNFPDWIADYFISATNLIITPFTIYMSWILFIISCLCLLSYIVLKIMHLNTKKQHYFNRFNHNTQFFKDIDLFFVEFSDLRLLVLIILLLILYPLCSTYFECTPIITWFTLSWFYQENNTMNLFYCCLLLILSILINLMFCHIVSRLYMIQLTQKNRKVNKIIDIQQSEVALSTTYNQSGNDIEDETYSDKKMSRKRSNESIESINVEYDDKESEGNKFVQWVKFIIFLILYILSTIMIVFYISFESLPDDNDLVNSTVLKYFVTKGMAFILAINNSIIVPKLFDSSKIKKIWKTHIVLYLRTINTLIVPIIASILLLNNCGKWWTLYWKPCNDDKKHQFDILVNYGWSQLNILSSNEICSPQSIFKINYNKCIRSFYYEWTYVLIIKYIIMIFMPFLIIIFKIIKHKLIRSEKQIKIDSEYIMLLTAFESVISFSIISPLIIPIVLIALYSSKISYLFIINKLKWKLTTIPISSPFPVHLLIIGILFGQCLTISFFIFAIRNTIIFTSYCILLCIMDTLYFYTSCKAKYKYKSKQ